MAAVPKNRNFFNSGFRGEDLNVIFLSKYA
jgi:hypothetical protein